MIVTIRDVFTNSEGPPKEAFNALLPRDQGIAHISAGMMLTDYDALLGPTIQDIARKVSDVCLSRLAPKR